MKHAARALVVLAASSALFGCAPATSTGEADGAEVTVTEVNGETVAVTQMEVSGRLYRTLAEFTGSADVVVEAKLSAIEPRLREVQPPAEAEGVSPGDGADIYGALDFTVTKVLKGEGALRTLRVVYLSGKRDGNDATKRIAYLQDGLSWLQLPNGEPRPANEFSGDTFVVFADRSMPTDLNPEPHADEFIVSHPAGIAILGAGGRLRFGKTGKAPVAANGNYADAPEVSLKQVRTSASSR